MKKIVIYIFIAAGIIFLSANKDKSDLYVESSYEVCKIDSIKNWYIIYAERNDSVFKIVSIKNAVSQCKMISIGEKYNLLLQKRIENVLSSNGLKLMPMNYLGVQNTSYNEDTDVFIEHEDGVFGLYTCVNLSGLCLKW